MYLRGLTKGEGTELFIQLLKLQSLSSLCEDACSSSEYWHQNEYQMTGSKSVSLCLFNPCCCFFIWTISDINFFLYDGSLSIILILSQSKSLLSLSLCSEITDGDPFFFLISESCSLILVRRPLGLSYVRGITIMTKYLVNHTLMWHKIQTVFTTFYKTVECVRNGKCNVKTIFFS